MPVGRGTWHTPISILKHYGRIAEKLETTGWTFDDITDQPPISFFGTPLRTIDNDYENEYDRFFAFKRGTSTWDQRKRKDNIQYSRDIHENVFQQEEQRPVPAIVSLDYGRPCYQFYDLKETGYRRVNNIKDFYRRRGETGRQFIEKQPR